MSEINLKLKTHGQLTMEIAKLQIDILCKDKEIERLNNIIDEFKNYLSQTMSKYEIEDSYDEGYYDCLVETNHYLNEFINDFKELKENK